MNSTAARMRIYSFVFSFPRHEYPYHYVFLFCISWIFSVFLTNLHSPEIFWLNLFNFFIHCESDYYNAQFWCVCSAFIVVSQQLCHCFKCTFNAKLMSLFPNLTFAQYSFNFRILSTFSWPWWKRAEWKRQNWPCAFLIWFFKTIHCTYIFCFRQLHKKETINLWGFWILVAVRH